MQFIIDVVGFLSTLSFVDVIFFFAVLSLMLLIITLIYFIKENNIDENMTNSLKEVTELNKKDTIEENTRSDEEIMNDAKDLLEIATALEQAEPNNSVLNRYEEEQEEKAIISYEELLERTNDFALNYSEEENIDEDLTIKKVDLNNLVNKEITIKPEIKVSVISYEKEEAFLAALKELQKLLN